MSGEVKLPNVALFSVHPAAALGFGSSTYSYSCSLPQPLEFNGPVLMHVADMAVLGTVKADCDRQVRILLNGCFDLMHVTRQQGPRPTSHAHSIRLWVPRSVCGLARDTNQDYVVMDVQTWRLIDFALHSCGRFLVAWADFQGRFLEPPSAFCCLCQTSLGICICFVNVC